MIAASLLWPAAANFGGAMMTGGSFSMMGSHAPATYAAPAGGKGGPAAGIYSGAGTDAANMYHGAAAGTAGPPMGGAAADMYHGAAAGDMGPAAANMGAEQNLYYGGAHPEPAAGGVLPEAPPAGEGHYPPTYNGPVAGDPDMEEEFEQDACDTDLRTPCGIQFNVVNNMVNDDGEAITFDDMKEFEGQLAADFTEEQLDEIFPLLGEMMMSGNGQEVQAFAENIMGEDPNPAMAMEALKYADMGPEMYNDEGAPAGAADSYLSNTDDMMPPHGEGCPDVTCADGSCVIAMADCDFNGPTATFATAPSYDFEEDYEDARKGGHGELLFGHEEDYEDSESSDLEDEDYDYTGQEIAGRRL